MIYKESELKQRIKWLIHLRWCWCAAIFVAMHIVKEFGNIPYPLWYGYFLIVVSLGYNSYFYFLTKKQTKTGDLQKNSKQQIIIDFLILTAAIHFSGGIGSPFLYFFIFHIIISGVLLSKKDTYKFAVFAAYSPVVLESMYFFNILKRYVIWGNDTNSYDLLSVAGYSGAFSITVLLTAYLSSYLADKLYKNQEKLHKLYRLSEKLKSSLAMNDVIEVVREELKGIVNTENIVYLSVNKTELMLKGNIRGNDISILLVDSNAFTDSLLACEPYVLETSTLTSGYEYYIYHLMGEPQKLTIIPVKAAYQSSFFDCENCYPDKKCGNRTTENGRCWYISNNNCISGIKSITKEIRKCLNCDFFAPVGVFVIPTDGENVELCMEVIDASSMAVSNAKLFEKTLELSKYDGLTGLKNKKTFIEMLDAEILRAKRYGKSFGLIFLDIDYFKQYNDRNGHPQGDILLKIISDIILKNVRNTDVVGRYGGEEFMILLTESSKDVAIEVAERIRVAVSEHNFPKAEFQPQGKITVSLGVAAYPDDGTDREKLIRAADDALYVAKITDKNKVVVANRSEEFIYG